MSRRLDDLVEAFQPDARELLERCQGEGYRFIPFYTLRTPWEQARFWRQSRSAARVAASIERLQRHGAPFLADVLHSVGPQHGRWATNALPGQGWHQWGEALDAYLLWDVDGDGQVDDACWDPDHPGYIRYAAIAREMGLKPGRDFNDSVHVQRLAHRVRDAFTWAAIDEAMRDRFGEEEQRP